VKRLELMIEGIKSSGFDKMKNEIEKKMKIKQELEKNIERLKNSLRIHNDHTLNCKTKTVKLQLENNMMYSFGEVITYNFFIWKKIILFNLQFFENKFNDILLLL